MRILHILDALQLRHHLGRIHHSHLTGENFIAPLPRMPAKWSTLSVRQAAHLVYFLCFVKTLRKEPETTES